MHPPGLLGLGRLGAPPYRVPRRACACRVRVRARMARASCRLQASSTCCPLPGFAGSCRVAVAVCFVRVIVVSAGSKEGGDLGGRVGALRLPPRLLRAARLPPSYAPLLSCPPTCCHRACSSACLSRTAPGDGVCAVLSRGGLLQVSANSAGAALRGHGT